jgi:hypothetical protein
MRSNEQALIEEESEKYIRSIEVESRHPEIFNMSRKPELIIEEIFQIAS